MKKYFKKVEPWIEKKLKVRLSSANLEEIFEKILELDSEESCILHYDFLRGNILFSNKVNKKFDTYPIVGILDFEKVCFGPTVADIARSLAFLIIDVKYKSEDKIRKRFLISGYERRGKNKLPQIVKSGDFEILLKFFWLRDFWKFLENNPYEFLYMNEHYLRTRDRLIKAKAVEFVIKGDEVKS